MPSTPATTVSKGSSRRTTHGELNSAPPGPLESARGRSNEMRARCWEGEDGILALEDSPASRGLTPINSSDGQACARSGVVQKPPGRADGRTIGSADQFAKRRRFLQLKRLGFESPRLSRRTTRATEGPGNNDFDYRDRRRPQKHATYRTAGALLAAAKDRTERHGREGARVLFLFGPTNDYREDAGRAPPERFKAHTITCTKGNGGTDGRAGQATLRRLFSHSPARPATS